MKSIRALLDHAIDYAGLFPPAGLDLREAMVRYQRYLESEDRWALGRFVVPVARLEQLQEIAPGLGAGPDHLWRLSALAGDDLPGDLERAIGFNQRSKVAVVEGFEFKAGSVAALGVIAGLPAPFPRYAELRWDQPPDEYLDVLQRSGIGAKLRTGGVTAESFPAPDAVLDMLEAIVRSGVPFKFTAGLHHPVRGQYRLTDEPDGPHGTMHGYLNMLLAAAALRLGLGRPTARGILLEEDPAAFEVDQDEIRWRQVRLFATALQGLRNEGSLAFGSCSFREPMDDLAQVPVR